LPRAQTNKQTAGLALGYAIKDESSVYIDFGEYSSWPDHLGNPVITAFYEYRLTPSFKAGLNLTYEKSKIDDFFLGESSARKYMLGFHWIGQYPVRPLHGEFGGYFKTGVITHEEFDDNPLGIHYGIIIGPAVDFGNISLAVHFQSGMGFFFQSGSPDDVMIFYPEVIVKVGYNF